MITYHRLFEGYIARVSREHDIAIENQRKNEESFRYVIGKLTAQLPYMETYSNARTRNLLKDLKTLKQVTSIKWYPAPIDNPWNLKKDEVVNTLTTFVNLRNILIKIREDVAYWEARIMDKRTFHAILIAFNEGLTDAIIKDAYEFNVGYGVSKILIRGQKRNNDGTLWGASLKKKQEIIDAGQIPYHPEHAPDGVQWLVLDQSDYTYFWKWTKRACNVTNKDLYWFYPTLGPIGNQRKLVHYIKNNPLVVHKYPMLIYDNQKAT